MRQFDNIDTQAKLSEMIAANNDEIHNALDALESALYDAEKIARHGEWLDSKNNYAPNETRWIIGYSYRMKYAYKAARDIWKFIKR